MSPRCLSHHHISIIIHHHLASRIYASARANIICGCSRRPTSLLWYGLILSSLDRSRNMSTPRPGLTPLWMYLVLTRRGESYGPHLNLFFTLRCAILRGSAFDYQARTTPNPRSEVKYRRHRHVCHAVSPQTHRITKGSETTIRRLRRSGTSEMNGSLQTGFAASFLGVATVSCTPQVRLRVHATPYHAQTPAQ